MRLRTLFTCLVAFGVVATTTLPAQVRAGGRYREVGACIGECCGFGPLVVVRATPVFQLEGDRTQVAFTAAVGDTLENPTGNLHHVRVGAVLVLRAHILEEELDIPADSATWRLTAGDTVPVLSYAGEGHYRIWYAGRPRVVVGFWPDGRVYPAPTGLPGRLIDAGQVEEWLAVRDRHGRGGWIVGFAAVRALDAPCG